MVPTINNSTPWTCNKKISQKGKMRVDILNIPEFHQLVVPDLEADFEWPQLRVCAAAQV